MAEPTRPDRIRGCLIGGAVGDALGGDIEFDSIEEIRALYGPAGVTAYPARDGVGHITDDTQMTLFTAEGLIRADNRYADRGNCNVPAVLHRAYLRWLLTQLGKKEHVPWDEFGDGEPSGWLLTRRELWARRAPGNTCLSALLSGSVGTPERRINDSKGCGGVMRVAPIGLVTDQPFSRALEAAAITHTHPTGYIAAGVFAQTIAHVVRGTDLPVAVTRAWERAASAQAELIARLVALQRGNAVPIATRLDGTPDDRLDLLRVDWDRELRRTLRRVAKLEHAKV